MSFFDAMVIVKWRKNVKSAFCKELVVYALKRRCPSCLVILKRLDLIHKDVRVNVASEW